MILEDGSYFCSGGPMTEKLIAESIDKLAGGKTNRRRMAAMNKKLLKHYIENNLVDRDSLDRAARTFDYLDGQALSAKKYW